MHYQEKDENQFVVRRYPAPWPIDCLGQRVPLPVPEVFNVSLTIAQHCLGVDPHASRQLPANPAVDLLSVVHGIYH